MKKTDSFFHFQQIEMESAKAILKAKIDSINESELLKLLSDVISNPKVRDRAERCCITGVGYINRCQADYGCSNSVCALCNDVKGCDWCENVFCKWCEGELKDYDNVVCSKVGCGGIVTRIKTVCDNCMKVNREFMECDICDPPFQKSEESDSSSDSE